jgi:hypothetical protein
MKKIIAALLIAGAPGAAIASGSYPTTLSPEERERHEFFDAQRGIRSGPDLVRHHEFIQPTLRPGHAPAAVAQPDHAQRSGVAIFNSSF